MLLHALEHVGRLEDERVRVAGLDLLPDRAAWTRSAARGRAASRRRRSSCARRSGSSRSAPCPCGAPSSGSTRSASGAATRGAARARATAASVRGRSRRRRRSAARRPGCPSSRRSSRSDSSPRLASASRRITRHLAALGEPGRRTGVEVEGHHRRALDLGHLATATGAAPGPRGWPARPASAGRRRRRSRSSCCSSTTGSLRTQSGPVRRALLLVEVPALDAVRVALERQGTVAQVRQQHGRDARVVVDHLALGEPDLGIHDLVQVRERELCVRLDVDRETRDGQLLLRCRSSSSSSRDPEPFDERAALLRRALRRAIEASSAAIRSGTSLRSGSGASTVIVSPAALRSIMSSTRSRYSSR